MTTINPTTDAIRLSRRGEHDLQAVGVQGDTATLRRAILDAACAGMTTLDEPTEVHFLARAVVSGREVVLLCLRFENSTRADKDATVVIRGIFSPAHAEKLLQEQKGLAAFARAIINGENLDYRRFENN